MILFTITKIERSTSPHFESKAQMAYGFDCLETIVFNWYEGFVVNTKDQIAKCKMGK